MREGADPCPERHELLCASEALTAWWSLRERWDRYRVRRHVLRCAACRAWLAYEGALMVEVSNATAGTFRVEGESGVPGGAALEFQRRLHKETQVSPRPVASWPRRQWVPIAVLLPLFAIASILMHNPLVDVHAAELLARVAEEERAWPDGAMQRWKMQVVPAHAAAVSYSRMFVSEAAATTERMPEQTERELLTAEAWPASLAPALAGYGLDRRRPLGVAAYEAWRSSLGGRFDEHVTRTHEGYLVVRTKAADGQASAVRMAELTIRPGAYHAVKLVLVVDGVGRVELEELAWWIRREGPGQVLPSSASPSNGAGASGAATVTAAGERDALDCAELDARLLLRGAELDLDRRIIISASPTEGIVHIDGSGASASPAARTIVTQLASIPRVRSTLIPTLIDAPSPSSASSSVDDGRIVPPALEAWLDQALGRTPTRTTFLARFQQLTHAVPARLAALEAVARRYPESDERRLSAAARAKLQRLVHLHYTALRADVLALKGHVNTLTGLIPGDIAATGTPRDWRRRTTAARPHAATLETQVRTLLTRDGPDAEYQRRDGQGPVSQTFLALWKIVNPDVARPSTP